MCMTGLNLGSPVMVAIYMSSLNLIGYLVTVQQFISSVQVSGLAYHIFGDFNRHLEMQED